MFGWLLDLLFPPQPLTRELLTMAPEEFARRAERNRAPVGKNVISLFSYRDALVRQAVWELKFRGNRKIAALLSALLHDELLAFLAEYAPLTGFTEPLLVPIPLSKTRQRKRGFNQCELLCDELMRLDSSRFNLGSEKRLNLGSQNFSYATTALVKIKDSPSQTDSETRRERLKNLGGCFSANKAEVEGRNVILIDDVATTGATLAEARRALLSAGARKVIAFTLAH